MCNIDDIMLYCGGESIETVVSKIEENRTTIITWFKNNFLFTNPNKFQVIFLETH